MLVFRMVTENGDGIYKPSSLSYAQSFVGRIKDNTGHYDWYHYHTPAPEDDGIEGVPENWLFGFGSERQMFRWFPPIWWMEAKRQGGLVTMWSVCRWDIIEGRRQVVFNPTGSILLDIIPCAVFKIGVK